MDVDRRWLHCGSVRNAVGDVERLGRGDYLYGSGERAGSCGGDADGSIDYRCEQERGYDHHDYGGGACGRDGKSYGRVGADRVDEKRYGDVDERSAE